MLPDMLPLPNNDEAPEAQPDRFPPCLFPASNFTQTGEGDDAPISRGYVELVLEEQWSAIEPSLTNLGINLPALLKAAWVLSLRCFVSVETICFGYRERIVVGNFKAHGANLEDVRINSNLMLCIVRVECGEEIQHFLQRLERSRKCLDVAASSGYEIRVVEAELSHHLCNTAIYYDDHYYDHDHDHDHDHEHKHGELQSKLWSDSVVSFSGRLGMNRLK